MSDPYAAVVSGGLKLKGAGTIQKKKQKVQHTTAVLPASTATNELAEGGSAKEQTVDRRTEAERRHDERTLKQEEKLASRQASKTHREKVADFNAHCARLSEHHDIPRVGPG